MTEIEALYKKLEECSTEEEREAIISAAEMKMGSMDWEQYSDWMRDSGAWDG